MIHRTNHSIPKRHVFNLKKILTKKIRLGDIGGVNYIIQLISSQLTTATV